jgi:hypothetical protein
MLHGTSGLYQVTVTGTWLKSFGQIFQLAERKFIAVSVRYAGSLSIFETPCRLRYVLGSLMQLAVPIMVSSDDCVIRDLSSQNKTKRANIGRHKLCESCPVGPL